MCQPSSSYLLVSACYTTNDGRVAPLAVPFPRTNESESLYGGDRRRRRRKTVAARWPRPCLGLTPSRLRRHLLPPPTGTPANERVRSPAASTMTPFSRARGFGCSSAPGRAWITTGRTEPFLHDSSDRPTSCAVIEFFFLFWTTAVALSKWEAEETASVKARPEYHHRGFFSFSLAMLFICYHPSYCFFHRTRQAPFWPWAAFFDFFFFDPSAQNKRWKNDSTVKRKNSSTMKIGRWPLFISINKELEL